MSSLKRLVSKDNKSNENWTMFSTSKAELKKIFKDKRKVIIGKDFLYIKKYPFEPSIAFKKRIYKAYEIDDIDLNSSPPTIRIKDELIFLTAQKKEVLKEFSIKNNLKIVNRPLIWECILEPFLDTEFTNDRDIKATEILASYGLTKDIVNSLRAEVKIQMLKYNFDSMLWEWCFLGADDLLRAMRTKYDKEKYQEFYKKVMEIALLPKISDK